MEVSGDQLGNEAPFVNVVDDDALVLRSLGRLLRSAGFAVRTFPSSQDFLSQARNVYKYYVAYKLQLETLEARRAAGAAHAPPPKKKSAAAAGKKD